VEAWRVVLAASLSLVAVAGFAAYRTARRLREARDGRAAALRDLQATRARLAESERAELAGRLAGALAHDLNNTLTLVIANAEWLTERLTDRDAAEAAAEISAAARNAATLTQQVLLASRAGMAQPRALDLARATAAAAGALRRLLPPEIQVETRLDEPAWTHFDPGQLQQVLLTLALNARAAMPGGGTLILAVRAGTLPAGGASFAPAVLEVSDTGYGLDPEERRRAFEPPSRRDGQASGFGLSAVKELVEAAGGQVRLRSVPGTGTVLTLSLPGAAPAPAVPPASARSRPAHVLVVEDDIRVRALICTALAEAGHQVSEVSDGTQAMRAIEEVGLVDLLVTDVVMPGAPVGEVITTFRGRHPDGRILVCSAFSEDESLRRRVYAGECRLLPKPFTRTELLAEVQAMLASKLAAEGAAAAAPQ
jgi:two-component system, cell cycle sensor histidine kinase and response regulator CckA